MKTRIDLSAQVAEFMGALAPEPRKRLRKAVRALERGEGDPKPLQGKLLSYARLRSAQYRVIYREGLEQGVRVIKCLFAEKRDFVYEMFERMRLDDLTKD